MEGCNAQTEYKRVIPCVLSIPSPSSMDERADGVVCMCICTGICM